MTDNHEYSTATKDLVEYSNRATNEKIGGVEARLKLVEDTYKSLQSSVNNVVERVKGVESRLDSLENSMTEVKSSLDGIKNIVNQSEGYKNGLKDGFKVLHWFTGIIFAIGGGAIAFLIQYVLKNMN